MARSEKNILGDKAIIFLNDFDVWQFRCWISEEKKYVRKSLKTKDETQATLLAEDTYIQLASRVRSGEKIFGEPLSAAINRFLMKKKSQIGVGDKYTIVEGRYKTIETHLRHFKRYAGSKTKITDIGSNILTDHTIEGEPTNYVLFRKDEGVGNTTISNEISTIISCFRYLYDNGYHSIRKINLPEVTKPQSDIDAELITRQTFTRDEYKSFTSALSKTYVAPVAVKNNVSASEWFDRQLARHYFLFAANSGMRSGELRKLRWEDVEIQTVGGGNTQEQKLAKVVVPALNTKVRKSRLFFCVGGVYLERWGKEFAHHRTGLIFSRDGVTELNNSFFNKHFRKVIALTKIDKKRRDQLVPYSLRHFCITQRVMAGCRFEDVALMCGTSSGQIERTYYHLNEEMMKRTATAKYTVRDGIAVPLVNLLDETLV